MATENIIIIVLLMFIILLLKLIILCDSQFSENVSNIIFFLSLMFSYH